MAMAKLIVPALAIVSTVAAGKLLFLCVVPF